MTEDVELFDVAGEEGENSPSNVVERIVVIAKECAELEETIESLNEALKAQSGRFHHLKSKLLPELMAEAMLPEFKWLDPTSNLPGVKIKIADYVSGSLPKEEFDREVAIEKLVEHGGEKLLTATITIDFPKSEREVAMKLLEELEGRKLDISFKEGVHAQTLCAFVREKLKNGEEIPYEELGVHVGKTAKIELLGKDGKKLKKQSQSIEE